MSMLQLLLPAVLCALAWSKAMDSSLEAELKGKLQGWMHESGIVDAKGTPDEKRLKDKVDQWLKEHDLKSEKDTQAKVDKWLDDNCFNDQACLQKRVQSWLHSQGITNEKGEGDPKQIEKNVQKWLHEKGLDSETTIKANVDKWIKDNCFNDQKCLEKRIHNAVDDAPQKVTSWINGALGSVGIHSALGSAGKVSLGGQQKYDASIPGLRGTLSVPAAAFACLGAISAAAVASLVMMRRMERRVPADADASDVETLLAAVE